MRALFDTSVLIAGMVAAHPAHERTRSWLVRARSGEVEGYVTCHSLAECYAVLTTLPVRPRIPTGMARLLLRENVEQPMKVVPLTGSDYRATLDRMSELGLKGGVVYDALAAIVASRLQVDRLLTLNPKDFLRAWPQGTEVIALP